MMQVIVTRDGKTIVIAGRWTDLLPRRTVPVVPKLAYTRMAPQRGG